MSSVCSSWYKWIESPGEPRIESPGFTHVTPENTDPTSRLITSKRNLHSHSRPDGECSVMMCSKVFGRSVWWEQGFWESEIKWKIFINELVVKSVLHVSVIHRHFMFMKRYCVYFRRHFKRMLWEGPPISTHKRIWTNHRPILQVHQSYHNAILEWRLCSLTLSNLDQTAGFNWYWGDDRKCSLQLLWS